MASNLVYSPVPAYPAAASASHVQGEVKLSADVDRDGKVASVRVISGPPLLRDAALDAVQRWRYRPYLWWAIPMAAIEIMDFQLPSAANVDAIRHHHSKADLTHRACLECQEAEMPMEGS
jgi:TonB family protein